MGFWNLSGLSIARLRRSMGLSDRFPRTSNGWFLRAFFVGWAAELPHHFRRRKGNFVHRWKKDRNSKWRRDHCTPVEGMRRHRPQVQVLDVAAGRSNTGMKRGAVENTVAMASDTCFGGGPIRLTTRATTRHATISRRGGSSQRTREFGPSAMAEPPEVPGRVGIS